MDYITPIIIAILSLIGTLSGSYFANKKSTALITYRLDQLEKEVAKINELIERIHDIEENQAVFNQKLKTIDVQIEMLKGVELNDNK